MRKGIILARKTWETAGGIAEEILYNIKTVASFANFEYELTRFYEKVEVVWRIDLINTCKLGFSVGFIIFFLNLCIFIAFIYGRTLIGKEINTNKGRDFRGGDVVSAAFCTLMGIAGIGMIAPNIKTIQESCSAASDYFNLYERKPAMDLTNSVERPPLSDIHGRIEFNGVNFYYPSDPNQRLILNGINLVFEPGQKVALVGESGCGKSTTVNLIERLYDATGGQLLIDGIEIKRYDIKYLRSLIGYVQQEPVLFNKSIRENLIFGREEYLNSIGNIDELIQSACDEAYASEFINNLPDGLDYVVGIKGSKLSGGQKQRIAIARAILAKPKILILDEATSALDNKSEKEVQRALDNISQKSVTTVIIAHRLSTIKNADLIYAIKGGKVLEQGTHKQLLEQGGYYAGLVRSQLAQDEIETQNKKEEIERKKSSIKRRNTDEEVHFERRDNEIAVSEKDVKIRPCIILGELCDFKLDLILACLGACILGCLSPINGLIMAKAINALNSKYQTVRYDDGLKWAFVFLALAFLQGIGNCLMLWKFLSLGLTLARIYRKKIMRKYLQFHLSYFDVTTNSPGALLTKMSIDTMDLNQLLNNILGSVIQCSCVLVVGLIIGCYYEYRLTLIDFCFVPFIVIANVIRRGMMQASSKTGVKANVEAGGILSECVINTKTIFSFNFQPAAIKMYLDAIEFIRQQFYRDALISGFFVGLGNFCSFAANASVYAAAKKFILDGSLDSEDMAIAMSVVTTCAQGISNGLGNLGNLRKAFVSFKSIYSTLDTPSLIPPYRRDNEGKISAMNIKGKIELKHVYFAYPTRPETIILKDVSLTIMPGQQAALVGYSGSGKSTIIQLLNRFYDVEDGKGEILIDDINIKDYNLYELRKKVGLVSQEPTLFRVSVLENVRYGNLEATDDQCIEAAREANIMKFFSKDKMNEVLGAPGKGKSGVGTKKDPVSGGEKQRLAIARAFLKNPTILLLDEATSALDKDSEL
jgi:ABC-type multidrug transport system fused ATPase/permease subunit